ncbi:rRNA methyltransferase 2, mitochondrial [Neolecta irregularis DAH-3]|uniref:rRNA methyltransferase 2, mitochondrial n=1 Tax=Neolecta irregularis (strain DAH-3) TaxID=1198029 RepID=A0A1U7LMB8_NEOID|nr:rRNA methyltransferase 2, mitochondrial [Neolecta irregularis DAH-3]|eukprot:OLL23692.1 rRNA methyltransferase 2, mitochondrial [Neolecta irregularis DAH-3]
MALLPVHRFLSTFYRNGRTFSSFAPHGNARPLSPLGVHALFPDPPPKRIKQKPYWDYRTRWIDPSDRYLRSQQAQLRYLYSKSAWKLLELNFFHKFLQPGMSVVDLGFAPGAWSTVTARIVGKSGRVLGVDMIPATAISGISSIQGNFYDKQTQQRIIKFMSDPGRGRQESLEPQIEQASYMDMERHAAEDEKSQEILDASGRSRMVDVVLSDMLEPFPQVDGLYRRSINRPYYNVKASPELQVKTHEQSIDLCDAALLFCVDTLKTGGSFVCKFYSGEEDGALESRLTRLFQTVKKDQTSLSNKNQDCYLIGLRRKAKVRREDIGV